MRIPEDHERLAQQREQKLRAQQQADRKRKLAELQRQLEESRQQAAERVRQQMQRRQHRFNPIDRSRLPFWKKAIVLGALCLFLWLTSAWGWEKYASWQSQAPVSLRDLIRAFDRDITQARKKYDGGAFELTGKAKLVQAGPEMRLAIDAPEVPQWSVHCKFDVSPAVFKSLVADKIQPGQDVTVEGRCSYRPVDGKVIVMEECVLRKSS